MDKNTTNNAEYTRKLDSAADMARSAHTRGGIDEMSRELVHFHRTEADDTFIAEYARIYHATIKKTTIAVW